MIYRVLFVIFPVLFASGEELQWHKSYEEALTEARETNKPILLQFRCVPCINGREFDAQIVYTDSSSERGKLMQKYVLARINSNTGIDIAKYDRDWHNSLYYFIINANEDIYLRYGGRDESSADRYLNLESFQLALELGLKAHKSKPAPLLKQEAFTPKDFPLIDQQVIQKKRCVECHLIGDYKLQEKTLGGFLDPLHDFYLSPDINHLGIILDIPKGLLLSETNGAALESGLEKGDLIQALNDKPVLTFGDLQYELNQINRYSKSIRLTVQRGEKRLACKIKLPQEWWRTDLSFRHWSNQPRLYFTSETLSDEEKSKHGLPKESFSARVTQIEMEALLNENHELEVGDIVLSVNNESINPLTSDLETHIILTYPEEKELQLTIKRAGKLKRMLLKPGHENFRKPPIDEIPNGMKLNWTEHVYLTAGKAKVVSYRATIVNEHLLIQVKHRPNWVTFALDNKERMIEKSVKTLEQELPTRIEVTPELTGKWKQSQPENFSNPQQNWYSWGFKGITHNTRQKNIVRLTP